MGTRMDMDLNWVAVALVVIGALNWGLVGIGILMNADWNLVTALFGFSPFLEAVIYLVVGLAGLWVILDLTTGERM